MSHSFQGCTVEPDTWYNKQLIIFIKLKQCSILLKLRLTGKVSHKIFFISAMVIMRLMII
jgi:hypothetical protein